MFTRQHIFVHLAAVCSDAGRHRHDAHHDYADDHELVVADRLLVDPQPEEDEGHRTNPAHHYKDQLACQAGSRRPVVELREAAVELISKRSPKRSSRRACPDGTLLASAFKRKVYHPEQETYQAEDPCWSLFEKLKADLQAKLDNV